MKFGELVQIVADEPVFDSGLLLAGRVKAADVRRQLSRWVRSGRLVQFRRGLYALAAPYRKVEPHPFVLANRIVPGSYVSLQAALAFHGLIPERVERVTSVTTRRPAGWDTPEGGFQYRHLKPELFFGFQREDLRDGQDAYVARPEKALLDLVHLTPGADKQKYLDQLRLQNLDRVDLERLRELSERAGKGKWKRAAGRLRDMVAAQGEEYEDL